MAYGVVQECISKVWEVLGVHRALVRHDRGKLTASPDLTNLRAERHVSTDKEDGRHVCGLLGEVLNGFTSSSVDLLEDLWWRITSQNSDRM